MKKLDYKYFFLLFIAMLSCFGVYTKTIHNQGSLVPRYVFHHSEINSHQKHFISQGSLAYEVDYENVEITESELEDSELDFDFFYSTFFSKYLNNISCNYLFKSYMNGLKDCFFTNYLISIHSFNVLFCVYRL